ncbi:DUF2079 domain-containing protein [Fluviicola taffensis]|uniref:DUF2079 domain-containing protein n=1 Tax=Fluviicola taffensis (strain DSM 16823 / NCIMB 13979 / RW262) TaxID=755732 RepID=F2IFX9_FLUTR|nr:DUF2079 domain-containing protein [Fluviicola taffensis]AEA43600.1 Protein of unknown function DUF2079, membrane [Fluviicola taffensis DSM 16823]
MRKLTLIKEHRFLLVALFIASVVYALITFVNQYCFRTYSLDLGVYTNAMYDYAHLRFNDSLAFKSESENLLADHFDLYLPLFSPLIYVFGSYTLLIVQWISILFGGVGIYTFFLQLYPNQGTRKFALIYFLLFFGVFAAISYDYHSNVVASMFVPWLFLAFERKKGISIIIWTILIAIGKENMALWLLFIAIGLAYINRKDWWKLKIAIGIACFSLIYFIVVIGWVMPSFSNTGVFSQFRYSVLGANVSEGILQLVKHPLDSLSVLFQNHSGKSVYNFVKFEFWMMILMVGFFCIFRPVYLFMLIPIIGQKMFHDNADTWGVVQQYCIEFAPILTIGTFVFIGDKKTKSKRLILSYIAVFLALVTSIRLMDNTIAHYDKARLRIYKSAHYKSEFPIKEAYEVLNLIPSDAIVSAQSTFVPHLAVRDKIYTFPTIKNAEFVLVSPVEDPYPLNQIEFEQETSKLLKNPDWKVVRKNNYFVLLKKQSL